MSENIHIKVALRVFIMNEPEKEEKCSEILKVIDD
jgi:hypothetical protein